jgi:valyl-tRNA synthetase
MRLNEYAEAARRFVWSELADWYVEAIKGRLSAGGSDGEVARAVLVHAFDMALRLLHPIVPFITESIWQRLPSRPQGALLMRAAWPAPTELPAVRARDFELVRDAVVALRQVRAEYAVPPGKVVDAVAVPAAARTGVDASTVLRDESPIIGRLAKVNLAVASHAPAGAAAHAILADGSELVVPLAGLIDVEKECARLRAELASLEKQLAGLDARLANENFTARAPAHVVQAERDKLRDWTIRRAQLREKVGALCGG